VIIAIDGHPVIGPDDLARYTAAYAPGQKVTLTILRDGQKRNVEVTLGRRPEKVPGG
jgi:S1-C subfamily serine protease